MVQSQLPADAKDRTGDKQGCDASANDAAHKCSTEAQDAAIQNAKKVPPAVKKAEARLDTKIDEDSRIKPEIKDSVKQLGHLVLEGDVTSIQSFAQQHQGDLKTVVGGASKVLWDYGLGVYIATDQSSDHQSRREKSIAIAHVTCEFNSSIQSNFCGAYSSSDGFNPVKVEIPFNTKGKPFVTDSAGLFLYKSPSPDKLLAKITQLPIALLNKEAANSNSQ